MAEKKVAIYCRVACADQLALDAQEKALRLFAEQNGCDDPVCYADNGYSGLRFDDRPAFQRLIADIETGVVETVIVRDVSRIGRALHLVEPWIEWATRQGVAFVTADQPYRPPSAVREALMLAILHEHKKSRGRK